VEGFCEHDNEPSGSIKCTTDSHSRKDQLQGANLVTGSNEVGMSIQIIQTEKFHILNRPFPRRGLNKLRRTEGRIELITTDISRSKFYSSRNTRTSWGSVSVVAITTGYGLDNQGVGVRVPVGSRMAISLYHLDRLWGPPRLSNGYGGGAPSQGVKWPELEGIHIRDFVVS
jgi:hypothetical protein